MPSKVRPVGIGPMGLDLMGRDLIGRDPMGREKTPLIPRRQLMGILLILAVALTVLTVRYLKVLIPVWNPDGP